MRHHVPHSNSYVQLKHSYYKILFSVVYSMAHHLTVKRLKFRPCSSAPSDAVLNALELASCAEDNAVKIYKVVIS